MKRITIKWDNNKVLGLVKECRIAGQVAADKKLKELQAQGDKWKVIDESTGREVGRMLDVCGGAWVRIDAKQQFYRVAKKLSETRELRFHCDHHYHGGGMFSVYDITNRQEMSVNEAVAEAIKATLEKYGVKTTSVYSYIG